MGSRRYGAARRTVNILSLACLTYLPTVFVARFCTWDDSEQYRENRNARAEGKKPLKVAAEVEKPFTCGFVGCGKTFANSGSAREHCRCGTSAEVPTDTRYFDARSCRDPAATEERRPRQVRTR